MGRLNNRRNLTTAQMNARVETVLWMVVALIILYATK